MKAIDKPLRDGFSRFVTAAGRFISGHPEATPMYKRLRLRLTAVCAVSTGLVLVAMAAVSLRFSTGQLHRQLDEAFQSSLGTVLLYLRDQTVIDHIWLGQTESAGDLFIRVEIDGAQLLYTSNHPRREALTAQAAETARVEHGFDYTLPPSGSLQPESVIFSMTVDGAEYRAAAAVMPSGPHWYSVILLKDTARERAQLAGLRTAFTLCVVLALLCLGLVAWFFTAWAVRPVQEGARRQTEFISAASHELRSPLAVMRVSAETIRTAPPEQSGHFAGKIERECDRLTRLTDDLLRLAGADSPGFSVLLAYAEPETIALTAGERFEGLAAQKDIRLLVELPNQPLPKIRCDAQRVEQLLAILLDNAIRHTPEGGRIRLAVGRRRRTVCFTVTDSGPGIPDDQKARVFDRFYRGDASRSGKEHYGLGLAVAKEIARLHRGSLSLRDAAGGGAEFVFAAPL